MKLLKSFNNTKLTCPININTFSASSVGVDSDISLNNNTMGSIVILF